jgi:hypothetical protein
VRIQCPFQEYPGLNAVACDRLLRNEEPRWKSRRIRTVEPSNLSDPSNSPCLPPADPQAVNEVVRRQSLLKSGQAPEWLFACGAQNGLTTWRHENKPVVLLFTTPLVAKDYIAVTKVAAEVRQFKVDALPATARNWLAVGAERFGLNRCPRCTVFNTYATQDLIHGKFLEFWSLVRALQWFRGEIRVREYMQYSATDRPRARAALELIRDHIDPGVAWVFELIAFHARMDSDQEANLAAIERLKDFGPEFADWQSRWSTSSNPAPMAAALARSTVGLCLSFGIQLNPKPSANARSA